MALLAAETMRARLSNVDYRSGAGGGSLGGGIEPPGAFV
jgi:hypothetical protein